MFAHGRPTTFCMSKQITAVCWSDRHLSWSLSCRVSFLDCRCFSCFTFCSSEEKLFILNDSRWSHLSLLGFWNYVKFMVKYFSVHRFLCNIRSLSSGFFHIRGIESAQVQTAFHILLACSCPTVVWSYLKYRIDVVSYIVLQLFWKVADHSVSSFLALMRQAGLLCIGMKISYSCPTYVKSSQVESLANSHFNIIFSK